MKTISVVPVILVEFQILSPTIINSECIHTHDLVEKCSFRFDLFDKNKTVYVVIVIPNI